MRERFSRSGILRTLPWSGASSQCLEKSFVEKLVELNKLDWIEGLVKVKAWKTWRLEAWARLQLWICYRNITAKASSKKLGRFVSFINRSYFKNAAPYSVVNKCLSVAARSNGVIFILFGRLFMTWATFSLILSKIGPNLQAFGRF